MMNPIKPKSTLGNISDWAENLIKSSANAVTSTFDSIYSPSSGAASKKGVEGLGSASGAGAYLVPSSSGGVYSPQNNQGFTTLSNGALSTSSQYLSPTQSTASGEIQAQAPSTAALLGMGSSAMKGGSALSDTPVSGMTGSGVFSPDLLSREGAKNTIESQGGAVPSSYEDKTSFGSKDWQALSQILGSIAKPQETGQQVQATPLAPSPRTGFSFDRKSFQNDALTRTYSDLYNKPNSKTQIKF